MQTLLSSLRLLAFLTLLLGGLYPALVWAVGQAAFPSAANGSLLHDANGRVIGSALLAQPASDPRHIHPRPSAADYATMASGASHLPWTSQKLLDRVAAAHAASLPAALATTSGSGLDPHLPPEAALAQLDRIAAARAWDAPARARAEALVAAHTEGGGIGPAHVNVLRLNLALHALDALPAP
jgi:potassium-transporting ATPase KdpC subunit